MNKKILKKLVPPLVLESYRKKFTYPQCSGDFKVWDEVKKVPQGYENSDYLEKIIRDAKEKRSRGDFKVLNSEKRYSKLILSALLLINNGGKINLIDFGGSLGNTYYGHRKILDEIKEIKWNIVEVKDLVDAGKKEFTNDKIRFYETIEKALEQHESNAILFSCVLQYLEEPYKILKKAIELNFEYIIIERTPFINGPEKIKIQKVKSKDFPTIFLPSWFFNEKKFFKIFNEKYDLVEEFDCEWEKVNVSSKFKGFIFRKRNDN